MSGTTTDTVPTTGSSSGEPVIDSETTGVASSGTNSTGDADTTTGGEMPTPTDLRFDAIVEYGLGGTGGGGGRQQDVDADGDDDFVLARTMLNQINVIVADGVGGYALGATYPANKPFDLVVGDVDGDAIADILVTRTDAGLWLLSGNGDGTFAPAVDRPGVAAKLNPVLADIDGFG